MNRLEAALKRSRESGALPGDVAGAADWLESHDEDTVPAELLDRFSTEDSAPSAEEPEPARESAPFQDNPASFRESPAPPRENPAPLRESVVSTADGRDGPRSTADRREPADADASWSPTAVTSAAPVTSTEAITEAAFAEPAEPPRSVALFSGFHPDFAAKVVSGSKMDRGTAEQYRHLAATLHHVQAERGIKKVMVTSALAGEGKTLTALNLALTLSESYRRRVVLIDADLRCSRVHELLNVANVSGLSDALKDVQPIEARLLPVSPRLSVLLAGGSASDPMGALTSPRMAQILDAAAASFDWVIVDTPPVALLSDTDLLARMVDGAVFVIQAGRTAYDVVERAVQTIDRKRVLGVVLNDVREAEGLEYYYGRS